jgi:putative transposase
MFLAVRLKILPSREQADSLLRSIKVLNEAYDYARHIAFKNKLFSRTRLHRAYYHELRKPFSLSAQMTVCAYRCW